MKRYWILIALMILAATVSSVWAQTETPATPNADYAIPWYTVDGGGGAVTGGAYTLDGTIGQADAGSLAGGGYTLSGGYWIGSAAVTMDYHVYLPLVLR
ncbi:hypothetical protein GPROT1_00686 [Gammaproteobacteria bacterium]|nr:hypothetical protein GPROT1_00686 [Gammaproteobacteria bacterium]